MTTPEKIARGLKAFEEAKAAHERKDFAEAAKKFQVALALMPNHPHVLVAYGKLAEEVPDWQAAEKIYRKIGELRPNSNYEASLGQALGKQGRYAETLPLFEAHLKRRPDDFVIWHALSLSYAMLDRWPESLDCARKARALKATPDHVDVVLNALYHLGRADELDELVDQEMALFPDNMQVRSLYVLHKLKAGDYAAGFRHFNALRWRNNKNRWESMEASGKVSGDEWDGTVFDGTLIINAEQGLGDEMMLSSMFDDILACGQETIVECDERLIPIYQRSYPGIHLVPRSEKAITRPDDGREVRSIVAIDAAAVFRSTREKFPATRMGWLKADPDRQQAIRTDYRQRWPGKRLVGISWKSTRSMEGGNKNIDIEALAKLLKRQDCAFVSLQYGDVDADIQAFREAGVEIYVDPTVSASKDIDGLAAQVAALDLVISISNTTVHIAGALGVPCWLLLPKTKPVLWYWGYRGEKTPWYPSIRMFRCKQENDWQSVIDEMAAALDNAPAPDA